MTAGEIEYDTIFINDQELVDEGLSLLLPELTGIIWVIFVIVMPVLFSNLLVNFKIILLLCGYIVCIINGMPNQHHKIQ